MDTGHCPYISIHYQYITDCINTGLDITSTSTEIANTSGGRGVQPRNISLHCQHIVNIFNKSENRVLAYDDTSAGQMGEDASKYINKKQIYYPIKSQKVALIYENN